MLITMRKPGTVDIKIHDTDSAFDLFVSQGYVVVDDKPKELKPVQNLIKRRGR
jgi:hypothetical protein